MLLLKYLLVAPIKKLSIDNNHLFEGGSFMGDKNEKNKNKKKLTTKEKKAQTHLRLMEGSKDRNAATTAPVAQAQNKDKKAA
jgi:hypothetical protein